MPSIPRGRRVAAAIASLALAASVLIPVGGVASAATASTTCPASENYSDCVLVVSAPESVVVGVPFTVQVSVGFWTYPNEVPVFTVAKSDPCASKVAVTLEVWAPEGAPGIDSQTANAAAGIASFTVTVQPGESSDGIYTLYASAGMAPTALTSTASCSNYDYTYGQPYSQFTALTIPATQPIAPCPDNTSCVQTFNGAPVPLGGTAATLIADLRHPFTGVGWLNADQLAACPGPLADQSSAPPVLEFHNLDAPTDKTIVLALAAKWVTKGIGQFQICWNGGTPFTPPGATQPVLKGVLPNCSKTVPAPCVLFRKSNRYNVGFFGVLAPWGPQDPKVGIR